MNVRPAPFCLPRLGRPPRSRIAVGLRVVLLFCLTEAGAEASTEIGFANVADRAKNSRASDSSLATLSRISLSASPAMSTCKPDIFAATYEPAD